jgi:hypothetical protein
VVLIPPLIKQSQAELADLVNHQAVAVIAEYAKDMV